MCCQVVPTMATGVTSILEPRSRNPSRRQPEQAGSEDPRNRRGQRIPSPSPNFQKSQPAIPIPELQSQPTQPEIEIPRPEEGEPAVTFVSQPQPPTPDQGGNQGDQDQPLPQKDSSDESGANVPGILPKPNVSNPSHDGHKRAGYNPGI